MITCFPSSLTTGAEETSSWARARAISLILSEMKNLNPLLENQNGGNTKTFVKLKFQPILKNSCMGTTLQLLKSLLFGIWLKIYH